MLWSELSKQVWKTWKSPDIYVHLQFFLCFMHEYSCGTLTLSYESLLRKKFIYWLLDFMRFFFPEARSPNLLQILPASLNLWKTLEYSGAKVKVLVFIFFSSYFSTGKSQRQRYFSVSHINIWYIGMEEGLFLWRLWFPFPISPTFDFRRYQVKEQPWVEEGQKKKKKKTPKLKKASREKWRQEEAASWMESWRWKGLQQTDSLTLQWKNLRSRA